MSSYLIEINTDQGVTRLAQTQVDVNHNGNEYTGGKIQKIGRVEQSAELKNGAVRISFSGVDKSIISLFENEDYRDRLCTIIECDISESWVVSSAKNYYEGDMIHVTYDTDTDGATVKLECKTLYGSINRANAPDLGILFSQWIADDVTRYFGKTAPINAPRTGKPWQPGPNEP